MLKRVPVETQAEAEALFPVVEEIWREVFTPMIGKAQVDYMMEHYQSVPVILAEIDEGVHYFALVSEGETVGYTAYELKGDEVLYLSKLYIRKDFRGKGYMKEIFDWYEKLAASLGRRQQLKVNQDNQHAMSVYRHRGFSLVKEQQVDIGAGFVMKDYIFEK